MPIDQMSSTVYHFTKYMAINMMVFFFFCKFDDILCNYSNRRTNGPEDRQNDGPTDIVHATKKE